jgi:hypothetical protein
MPTTQTDGLRYPIVVKAVFTQESSARTHKHQDAQNP